MLMSLNEFSVATIRADSTLSMHKRKKGIGFSWEFCLGFSLVCCCCLICFVLF